MNNKTSQTGRPPFAQRPLARADLARVAASLKIPVEVVEKDYVLSYLLAGLADVPELSGLRFKGGTALKKIHFGPSYRFSEDLEFSAVNTPQGAMIEPLIGQAVRAAQARLEARGRFRLEFDRPPERGPHPAGQDAFRVRAAFPWQTAPMVRVKVEVTHDEPVMLPTKLLPLQHGYEELAEEMPDVRVHSYALDEIVAEKLRALRQTHQRLEARGWNRPRARDYYDLWRILSERQGDIDQVAIRNVLPAKMAHRGVGYQSLDDFFTLQLTQEARRHWKSNLGTFVSTLPDVETVLTELQPLIGELLAI